ncbi:(Fe-S)-binding protein [Corynebacterium yudongzhengii]|uniref:(Fe-S)-binding protein n=1 Tax=Corynebacterium yudongzhengii TaxID=2080740 RepID=A0A2U1T9D7_9CORY|nr:(Fe-S)-binding protein [Corynebacterium yudongzhengii]AWB82130.1 (Fe-S)-binding protein [Corynebacterium yudongzhengii]PWC02634.1 (Fe-S)-binding protein [Corynebacterium yudongzhengii]
MRIALFSTCIGDALFPDASKATALILSRLGHEVVYPEGQTCCGQMHINSGYQKQAAGIVETYVDAFSDPSIDAVVAPSGSCVTSVRNHQEHVVKRYGTPALVDGCRTTAQKTYELSEFLVDVEGTTELGAYFPHRVTYHPSCHGKRMLKVGERPYQLLRNVEGMELVELGNAEECCGFGGTFAIKNADVSSAMAADKARHIADTNAEYVTGGDSSCLMNIAGVLSRQHYGVRAVHMAEILASTKDQPWTPSQAAYRKEAFL